MHNLRIPKDAKIVQNDERKKMKNLLTFARVSAIIQSESEREVKQNESL